MTAELSAIQSWKTWTGFPTTAEVGATGAFYWPTTTLSGVGRKTVVVHPYTAIAIRMFGKDAENETATIEFIGYMTPTDAGSKYSSGPGQVLWLGQVVLGSITASAIPLSDGKWGAAATWFQVDTFDIAGVSGGHNAANAAVVSGGNQAMLILPTLGYTHIVCVNADMDGSTGVEMAELGVLYREVAMGGVV